MDILKIDLFQIAIKTGDSALPLFIAFLLSVVSGITAWFTAKRKKHEQ